MENTALKDTTAQISYNRLHPERFTSLFRICGRIQTSNQDNRSELPT